MSQRASIALTSSSTWIAWHEARGSYAVAKSDTNHTRRTMQDCFRQHPDIYGAELTDTEGDLDDETAAALADSEAPETAAPTSSPSSSPTLIGSNDPTPASAPYSGSTPPSTSTPDHNLTAAPSASPTSVGGSSGTHDSDSGTTTAGITTSNRGTKIADLRTASSKDTKQQGRSARAKEAKEQVTEQHGDSMKGSEKERSEGDGRVQTKAAADEAGNNTGARW